MYLPKQDYLELESPILSPVAPATPSSSEAEVTPRDSLVSSVFDSVDNIWTSVNNELRKDSNPVGNNGRYNMASNLSQESGYGTSKDDTKYFLNNENDNSDADSEPLSGRTRVMAVDGKRTVYFRPSLQSEV